MLFQPLTIAGAFVVEPQRHSDDRGFFARTFCEDELADAGLVARFRQSSISFNARRGTVRGMHFARAPHAETKIVRCTAGAIHDVIVDLRRESATYLAAAAVTLSAENRRALYIPRGLAHGFQTLEDSSEILYMIDVPYVPGASAGVRWNDPAIRVAWPEPITVIAERDLAFADWT